MLQAAARRGSLLVNAAPHRPLQALIDVSGAQRIYSTGIDGVFAGVQTAGAPSTSAAPRPPAVLQLHSDDEVQTALTALGPHGLAIFDFSAVWCPPCKMIAPLYEELAARHPDINFYKIDIDEEAVRATVLEQAVASVPTFVSYRGGKRLDHFSGADRAALQLMVDALSSAAA